MPINPVKFVVVTGDYECFLFFVFLNVSVSFLFFHGVCFIQGWIGQISFVSKAYFVDSQTPTPGSYEDGDCM